jgi:hypothetical protein
MSINIYDLSNDVIKQILSYYYTLNDMINIKRASKEIYKICQELNHDKLNWNNKIYILHKINKIKKKNNKNRNQNQIQPKKYSSKEAIDFLIIKKRPDYLHWLKQYLNYFNIKFETTRKIYQCCDIETYDWYYNNVKINNNNHIKLLQQTIDNAIENDAVDFIKYLKTIYEYVELSVSKIFECPTAINMLKYLCEELQKDDKHISDWVECYEHMWKIQENDRAEICLQYFYQNDLYKFYNSMNHKNLGLTNVCEHNYKDPNYYLFWYDFFKSHFKKDNNDILKYAKNKVLFTDYQQIQQFYDRNIKIKIKNYNNYNNLNTKIGGFLLSHYNCDFIQNLKTLINCKDLFYVKNNTKLNQLTIIVTFYNLFSKKTNDNYNEVKKYVDEFNNVYAKFNFKLIIKKNADFSENDKNMSFIKTNKSEDNHKKNVKLIISGIVIITAIYFIFY